MKQSTKLLSIVLALVMAFSCMSVVGNAGLAKGSFYYDSIDDAILSPEQVADIALDLVDDLLASMGDDLYIDLTVIKLDLRSINSAFASLLDVGGTASDLSGLLGEAGDINARALSTNYKLDSSPYQRGHGDLVIVRQLLRFLSDNASLVAQAVHGINVKGGLELGTVGSFLGDSLDDINAILANLPGFAKNMVYDLIIHGSYNATYKDESFPASDELSSLPGEVDTLAEMIDYAIASLLTNPQEYEWVDTDGDGKTDKKVWDHSAKLLPSVAAFGFAAAADYFSVAGTDFDASNNENPALVAKENTIFEILDKAAPFAIYDLAIPALNYNLKKGLMEAVDADLNEVPEADVPADILEKFKAEDYVTYISYDCMLKDEVTGRWYYTTLESETIVDKDGNPVLDTKGNEQSQKVRKYFVVNLAAANEFASVIDWDWNIIAPAPGTGDVTKDTVNELNYDALIAEYGSITESLNDIVALVYDNALTDDVKEDFVTTTGDGWVTGATSSKFNYNIERLLKYLLGNYGDKIFGADSAYADEGTYNYEFYAPMSLIDIVALIGPEFFEDVMPQLIIPKNEDGSYAFAASENGESVAFLQFGAIVIREFMTEIAPNVNYDAYIYAEGSLTDGSGRQFADHSADEWFNIILNMGMDIAYTYLGQITNFGDKVYYDGNGLALDLNRAGYRSTDIATPPSEDADATSALKDIRWKDMLNKAIDWAVSYVGQDGYSVLKGFEPNTFKEKFEDKGNTNPLDKLSYILNTLLPLGFVNGLEDGTYDLSVARLFDRLKIFLTKFDFNQLIALFGRNGADGSTLVRGNILNQPVQNMVITLISDILYLVFGKNILASASSNTAHPTTLDGIIDSNALERTVQNLLTGLYDAEQRGLIKAALPVVGKLIKGWGTEQRFRTPDIDITSHLRLSGGNTSEAEEVVITNKADGVWRSWVDASGTRYEDEHHYNIKIVDVVAYDMDGSSADGVSINDVDKTNLIYYGKTTKFNFTVSGVTNGKMIRVETQYQVYEDESLYTNDVYTTSNYVYLDNSVTDAGQRVETGKQDDFKIYWGYTRQYIDIADLSGSIEGVPFLYLTKGGKYVGLAENKPHFTITSGSGDGLVSFSGSKVTLNDGDREWSLTPYKSQECWAYGADAKSDTPSENMINITSSGFNKTEWDKLERKSGDTGTIVANVWGQVPKKPASLVNKDKIDYSATITVPFKYYNSSERADLANTLERELALGKVKADYSEAAWTNYANAINTAADAVYTELRAESNLRYVETKEALEAAIEALDATKSADAGAALKADIADLKTKLDSVEATYTDNYDYTDYKMYRINRLNDARDDARWLVDLQKDASRNMADIDSNFPYNGMTEADLKAVVAANSSLNIVGGKDNANLVTALLEELSEEEYKDRANWLADRKIEYAGVSGADVDYASDMLTKTSSRLLNRTYKANGNPDFYFINTEIASAEAEIDADNTDEAGNQIYTDRSWAKYTAALQAAKDVVNGANGAVKSQKNAFDAKWELLCCRNELVLVEDEADYAELEALIAQAEQVMANLSLYDNTAKELGQVLAELGVKGEIVNADGDGVNLFPGSAYYVNAEPYSVNDQDEIDNKATELKVALARLKFYNLKVEANGVEAADKVIVAADDEAGIEAVIAKLATIDAEMDAEAVKELFTVTATGANVSADLVTVSKDLHYTVETPDEFGFAGTNSVVTFYTVEDGINIPVATVRLIVKGDINGDGVVDAIDSASAFLVSVQRAELEGCYFVAGNLTGDQEVATGKVDAADYSAIVNLAVPNRVA